ncbi:MAG TPA: class I SAM-dependent methyltransferase, partial [Gemmatimonadaceae bacterium]
AVALIADTLGDRPVSAVLDLACGSGRHARYLGRRWWTSGVDLSEVLLRIAQKNGTPAKLVRADIRALPYRNDSFDLIVNLFTSFGYFATDEEHDVVVRDLSRVIRPGGTFVLDFLNARFVRDRLVPRDETRIRGRTVEQRREITPDGRFVVKHIDIRDEGNHFIERVRLFSREELVVMLERAGFRIERTYGDYDGSPPGSESPRVILFARRN